MFTFRKQNLYGEIFSSRDLELFANGIAVHVVEQNEFSRS